MASKGRVAGLDAVRVFAAGVVAFGHLAFGYGPSRGTVFPELAPYSNWGAVGVPIFFVISGFVIAHSAVARGPRDFIVGRVLRLAPGLWICSTLTLLVALALGLGAPQELGMAYAKSVGLYPFGGWIDPVVWTLTVEVVFYAVVALLLVAGRARWLENLAYVLTGVTILRAAAMHVVGVEALPHPYSIFVNLLLLQSGCYFAFGIFIWAISDKGLSWPRLVGLGVAGAACIEGLLHDPVAQQSAVIAFVLSVVAIAMSLRFNDRIISALGPRWAGVLRVAGLATYPMYLLHNRIGEGMLGALRSVGADRYLALTVALGGVTVLAIAVTLVGEPFVRGLLAMAANRLPRSSVRRAPTR